MVPARVKKSLWSGNVCVRRRSGVASADVVMRAEGEHVVLSVKVTARIHAASRTHTRRRLAHRGGVRTLFSGIA